MEHPPCHLPLSPWQQTGAGEETVNSTGTQMPQKTCVTAELGAAKL